MRQMFDLTGKVIIVTGAARGLGAKMAESLAEQGADLVIIDLEITEGLLATKKKIEETGQIALPLACDISSDEQVKSAIEHTIREFNKIDVLVNNAGLCEIVPLEKMTHQTWQKQIDVDLTGAFLVSKHVGKYMIERKYGRIINIASVRSLVGSMSNGIAAYASAKGGVATLTRQMAAEWGKYGITANAIAPGLFITEINAHTFQGAHLEQFNNNHPMGRPGILGELDGTVIYLGSDAASYVNGQLLVVDGGMTVSAQ